MIHETGYIWSLPNRFLWSAWSQKSQWYLLSIKKIKTLHLETFGLASKPYGSLMPTWTLHRFHGSYKPQENNTNSHLQLNGVLSLFSLFFSLFCLYNSNGNHEFRLRTSACRSEEAVRQNFLLKLFCRREKQKQGNDLLAFSLSNQEVL